jgi:hypothetical protein
LYWEYEGSQITEFTYYGWDKDITVSAVVKGLMTYKVKFSLVSIVRKVNVPCQLLNTGSISLNGVNFTEYTLTVQEGQTLLDLGIDRLPVVDPIEPASDIDEYSFVGYWKYVYEGTTKYKFYDKNQVGYNLGDITFNYETFPEVPNGGTITLIPHCKAHWTPAY